MTPMTNILSATLGGIWASSRIWNDFAALTACGRRFAGTESEAGARGFLATRIAEATGAPVARAAVAYRG